MIRREAFAHAWLGADPGNEPMHKKTTKRSTPKRRAEPSSSSTTWRALVTKVLQDLGTGHLAEIYSRVEAAPKARGRKHWKAKVRQVLEMSDEFVRVDRGMWRMRDGLSTKAVKKYERLRRELYPRRVSQS